MQYSSSAFHFTLALTQRKMLRALASELVSLPTIRATCWRISGVKTMCGGRSARQAPFQSAGSGCTFGLVQLGVVGEGVVFKDLLEHHGLGGVGDLLLEIDCALRGRR